jgi:murein DD-endopeptidase MepM/ murein hydrolase activator NlpD
MRRDSNKKSGAPVILAGLGGFLLGAATILFVLWIYTTQTRTRSVPAAAPAPAPASPQVSPPVSPQAGPATPAPSPLPVIPVGPPAAASAPPGDLAGRNLLLPVQGIRPAQLQDTFGDSRGGGERHHEALDIMAPQGTPVLATEDGKVAKLFTSKLGGLTIYQFDPTSTYAYYYAHLDRYADGLKEGDTLRRGQVIAYVGSTGDADAASPHLHFTIFRLTPEKQWWKGEAINPYGLLR